MVGYIGQVVNPIFKMASHGPEVGAPDSIDSSAAQTGVGPRGALGNRNADRDPVDVRGRGEDEVLLERAEDADIDDDEDIGLPPPGQSSAAATASASGDLRGGREKSGGAGRPLAPGEVRGYITLIARMAVARSGTLLWRKGLDLQVCGSLDQSQDV